MSTCQHCAEKDRQIIELEDALTNERAGVSQHKAEADLVRQDMGEKLAEAKRRIAELDEQRRLAVNQRDNAERNQEVVSKQNAMLRDSIAELESETCGLRDKVSSLLEHINTQQALLDEACRGAAKDKERVAVLEAAHDALEGRA